MTPTLTTVTLTGADDSVDPNDLLALSREFPFVEWGILFGADGAARYPSHFWVAAFSDAMARGSDAARRVRVSAHLRGHLMRDYRSGGTQWSSAHPMFARAAQRVQLNSHAYPEDAAEFSLDDTTQVILQVDGVNDAMVRATVDAVANVVPLFDISGGAGLVPSVWPRQWQNDHGVYYSGYAGGLGPENVRDQLRLIWQKTHGEFWIDMETRIRSNAGRQFDLAKCRDVLEQLRPLVGVDGVRPW